MKRHSTQLPCSANATTVASGRSVYTRNNDSNSDSPQSVVQKPKKKTQKSLNQTSHHQQQHNNTIISRSASTTKNETGSGNGSSIENIQNKQSKKSKTRIKFDVDRSKQKQSNDKPSSPTLPTLPIQKQHQNQNQKQQQQYEIDQRGEAGETEESSDHRHQEPLSSIIPQFMQQYLTMHDKNHMFHQDSNNNNNNNNNQNADRDDANRDKTKSQPTTTTMRMTTTTTTTKTRATRSTATTTTTNAYEDNFYYDYYCSGIDTSKFVYQLFELMNSCARQPIDHFNTLHFISMASQRQRQQQQQEQDASEQVRRNKQKKNTKKTNNSNNCNIIDYDDCDYHITHMIETCLESWCEQDVRMMIDELGLIVQWFNEQEEHFWNQFVSKLKTIIRNFKRNDNDDDDDNNSGSSSNGSSNGSDSSSLKSRRRSHDRVEMWQQKAILNARVIAQYQMIILLLLCRERLRGSCDPLSHRKRRMLYLYFRRIAIFFTVQTSPTDPNSLYSFVKRTTLLFNESDESTSQHRDHGHDQHRPQTKRNEIGEFGHTFPKTLLYLFLKLKLMIPSRLQCHLTQFLEDRRKLVDEMRTLDEMKKRASSLSKPSKQRTSNNDQCDHSEENDRSGIGGSEQTAVACNSRSSSVSAVVPSNALVSQTVLMTQRSPTSDVTSTTTTTTTTTTTSIHEQLRLLSTPPTVGGRFSSSPPSIGSVMAMMASRATTKLSPPTTPSPGTPTTPLTPFRMMNIQSVTPPLPPPSRTPSPPFHLHHYHVSTPQRTPVNYNNLSGVRTPNSRGSSDGRSISSSDRSDANTNDRCTSSSDHICTPISLDRVNQLMMNSGRVLTNNNSTPSIGSSNCGTGSGHSGENRGGASSGTTKTSSLSPLSSTASSPPLSSSSSPSTTILTTATSTAADKGNMLHHVDLRSLSSGAPGAADRSRTPNSVTRQSEQAKQQQQQQQQQHRTAMTPRKQSIAKCLNFSPRTPPERTRKRNNSVSTSALPFRLSATPPSSSSMAAAAAATSSNHRRDVVGTTKRRRTNGDGMT